MLFPVKIQIIPQIFARILNVSFRTHVQMNNLYAEKCQASETI